MDPVQAPLVRVLVIDDDAVMRELLEALLGAEGYAVEAVESGEVALSWLRSGSIAEVVLADVQLPGISGAALAGELRTVAPQARLLGMSGSEPGAEVRAAYQGFLLKPFSPEEFAALVHRPQESSSAESPAPAVEAEGRLPLDEAIFRRLAGSLSAAHLRELYEMTLDDASKRLARMADALATGDFAAYRGDAHALKGGCSMVGAGELATLAARAEVAEPADAGSFRSTPTTAEFLQACERLRDILAARLHNG